MIVVQDQDENCNITGYRAYSPDPDMDYIEITFQTGKNHQPNRNKPTAAKTYFTRLVKSLSSLSLRNNNSSHHPKYPK